MKKKLSNSKNKSNYVGIVCSKTIFNLIKKELNDNISESHLPIEILNFKLPIYEKDNQKADGWLFTSQTALSLYLNDFLTEKFLELSITDCEKI